MADNQQKAQKDRKKKVEEHDEKILLSDSDDGSLADIECDTCGVSLPSVKAYENHVQGRKHQKKVAETKYLAKNQIPTKKKEESDSEDDEDMYCEVCDKYFTGFISYASHMKGSVHAKNVKKQKLKEQLSDMPEVLDKEKEENDSDDDDVLQKPYARCTTCQKEFSGPEPFKMHVKSAAHQKKVKQSQTLEKLKAGHEGEAKNSDDEEFFKKCDACQKSFSGLVPYQVHMQSRVHKKSLEKLKVAEEIKEFCANDDFSEGYVCKDCKKTFTDPLGFKSHLQNNSHEKQKAKTALLEFLNAYPEVVFATPLDKENSEGESDSDEADQMYYLICKLCHASFSGPESAQDHVKSKKHISIKREKKAMKLLKEQKKSSSVKSDDKSFTNGNNKSSEKEKNSVNGKSKNSDKDHVINVDDFELI